MISFTKQQKMFTDYTQNYSVANYARGAELANIEHKYLLQKYFNNEGSFSVPTIGANSLTTTVAAPVNAKSATLSVSWAYATSVVPTSFSDGENRDVLFTNGSTAITWQVPLNGTQFATTGVILATATSATLNTAWSTTTQTSLTVFSDGSTQNVTFTKGSATITWATPLAQSVLAYVNTSINTTTITIGGVQFYRMPPNYSKLKDITLTVGVLKWTLNEIRTREEWDRLNVFPYYAAIPQSFFIYPGGDHNGQIGIWPIPSTTGNTLTFNYKFRVPDLSIPDYGALTYTGLTGTLIVGNTITAGAVTGIITSFSGTTICISDPSGTFATGAFTTSGGAAGTISAVGLVSINSGSTTVTGVNTAFIPTTNAANESRWIKFNQPTGDETWYQIASVDGATSITLFGAYQGITVTSSSAYTIGQMSILPEDFQDMLVWRPVMYYYSSIVKDKEKYESFNEFYKEKLEQLSEYSGSNTINVNLSPRRQGRNPNLFPYKLTG